jgi:hypothetical protein
VEQALRLRGPRATVEEQRSLESEQAMLRRALLAIDIIVCAGIGYTLGARLWG